MEENEKKNGLKIWGGENGKKRFLMILPIVAIAVVALAALSTPALADYYFDGWASTTRTNGTINGTVFVDSVGWNGQTTLSGSFDVPSGTVKWAYLYTGVWGGNPDNTGWVNVTFNDNYATNGLGPIHLEGEDDSNDNVWCTGYGKYWWWYNVTNLTNAGQTNTATVSEVNGSLDGRVYGIVLVVVLENNSLSPVQYWINDGSDGLHYETGEYPEHNSGTTYFNGTVDNANVTNSALTVVHLTGYSPKCGNSLDFNDHPLDTNCVDSNNFEINTWDETNSNVTPANVTSSGNHADYRRCEDPYVNICNAILVLHNTTATEPDLVVSDIELPEMMRPSTDFTVKATITNQGSATGGFNVSLYANDVLTSTKQHVSSLAAGASTEVSFTNVNLGEGCYEFTVVADCDGEVPESNENNNETSENGQVGYVIVVESDGDFEKLNTSGSAPLPAGCFKNESGTYYIQNLTIENCNGNGITIENTDATFVITNCTIKNCTYSGVKFHNLSDGTIENSTVQNNTEYGIEVGEVPLDSNDPNNVTIKNNLISDTEIDVELIAYNSTVISNTIWDNTEYAIYLYGSDNNITYNILKNNVGYAIKAYNSYDNYIYENEFICNNIGNPGHQAWDNGNSNHWNTTTIGNYWTDWDDNPGAPGEYSIDGGGGNKDYHPRGLFVFGCNAGTDKWAYKYQVNARPPTTNDVPSIEFNTTQYANIAADDQVFETNKTTQDDYYAAHRFNFSINSSISASAISMINVTWNGKGWHESSPGSTYNGTYLYIWNSTAGAGYEELDSNPGVGTEATLTGGNTSGISNYINANNVTVLAEQRSAQELETASHIETDYIKLVITPF